MNDLGDIATTEVALYPACAVCSKPVLDIQSSTQLSVSNGIKVLCEKCSSKVAALALGVDGLTVVIGSGIDDDYVHTFFRNMDCANFRPGDLIIVDKVGNQLYEDHER